MVRPLGAGELGLSKVLFVQPNINQAYEYHQTDYPSHIALWMRVGSVVPDSKIHICTNTFSKLLCTQFT